MSVHSPKARPRLAMIALVVALAGLGGCKDMGDVTGSIGASNQKLPTSDSELRAYAERWGERYDSNPGEKTASINYARALRALTQYKQAAAVMQVAAVKAPNDFDVLAAYGKALADAGQWKQANDVLSRSYTPERPNWSSMSAQGVVADALGDHDHAQQLYRDALKIAPGEPSILANMGLSFALMRQLPLAEQALREAAASPAADVRVRENLALVLALQGKFAEAETIERRDLSAEDAAANVSAIRQMIAQSTTWRDIQAVDAKKHGQQAISKPAG